MSYETPAPPQRERPPLVTISSWLLYLVAALSVVSFVVSISLIGTWNDIFTEAFEGTEAEGVETVATVVTVAFSGISLLFGIAFAVLAIFNNQGRNPARIVTWVLGGISLCCGGLGLLSSVAGNSTMNTGGDVDEDKLTRLIEENIPGWYEPLSSVLGIASIVALLAALILLALPVSNQFFRKPEPFEPPPPDYPVQ